MSTLVLCSVIDLNATNVFNLTTTLNASWVSNTNDLMWVNMWCESCMLCIFLLMCSLRLERLPWSGETKHNLLGKFLSVQTYSQLFHTIKEKLENTWECGSWTENEPITTQGPYTLFSNQQSTVSKHPSKIIKIIQ